MVGVRLPARMLKKLNQVAEALGADRSDAIRFVLEHGLNSYRVTPLLRLRKGRGITGLVIDAISADYQAQLIEQRAKRARPARKGQAEINALRVAEKAAQQIETLADKLAKPRVSAISGAPALPISPSLPYGLRRARQRLSKAEVEEAVNRAVSRSKNSRAPRI